jgi:putative nucleotidyltransferase with HDIG domain
MRGLVTHCKKSRSNSQDFFDIHSPCKNGRFIAQCFFIGQTIVADHRQHILDYVHSLSGLPTLNSITKNLVFVTAEQDIALSRLVEVIQYDPGLSSRIISVSNSAWYSRGVPIVSLERAIATLGVEEVRNIITCALFYDGVLKGLGLKKKFIHQLWEHSLIIAFAAKSLSREDGAEGEESFVCGLLHDIGKVPLQLLFKYGLNNLKYTVETICDFEETKFGIDHAQIGFEMAMDWKLPEDYRQAIRLHHRQQEETVLSSLVRKSHVLMFTDTEEEEKISLRKSITEEAEKVIALFDA